MEFDKVWNEYKVTIKKFLAAKVSNRADVDDLFQEVSIKIFNNLDVLCNEESIKYWILQIANRVVIDFYRKNSKDKLGLLLVGESSNVNKVQEEVKTVVAQCIVAFIDVLPQYHKELLTVIDMQGQSQKQYAAQMGIKYSTLKSQVQKARAELKVLFENCCRISFDKHKNIADFEMRSGYCKNC